MSRIAQLEDGRWMAYASLGHGDDRRRRKKLCGSKREANAVLRTLEEELAREAHLEPHELTVGAYLTHWVDHMRAGRAAPHTIEVYECIVRRNVTPKVKRTKLKAVKPLSLQQMLDARITANASPNTVRREYMMLHAAFAQAVRWRLIVSNPLDDVRRPAAVRREMQALDERGTAKLLERLDGTRFWAPAFVDVTTGLRRGELLALRWSDVDLRMASLRVERSSVAPVRAEVMMKEPKTHGSKRTIGLMAATVAALAEHKRKQAAERLKDGPAWHDSGLVFPRAHGEPWRPTTFSSGWRHLKTGVRFHDLRHTHATILLRSGVPVDAVAKRLGHASPVITMTTYAHVLEDADVAAVECLENGLGGHLAASTGTSTGTGEGEDR